MKNLFFDGAKAYKANLHCHSTVSDGRFTPEELKEMYQEKGYSIIAYTDHGKLIPHDDLTDESFLALNGAEMAWTDYNYTAQKDSPLYLERKCTDHGLIAPKGVTSLPKIPYPANTRLLTPENVNSARRLYMDAGFFLTHNHPMWSLETYDDYMSYETPTALEIINYGSFLSGAHDHNEHIFEDMLMGGKRVFCIATDDNHNKLAKPDSFGAWTVVMARELEYGAVMDALFAGSFYSSEGPEIKELYVDDKGKLHVVTSPAASIRIATDSRSRKLVANADGTPVTEGTLGLSPTYKYVRVVVTDEKGRKAFSNAYFIDEILDEK